MKNCKKSADFALARKTINLVATSQQDQIFSGENFSKIATYLGYKKVANYPPMSGCLSLQWLTAGSVGIWCKDATP